MSNGSGSPPKGESEIIDVVPQSRPLVATKVDDAWFDVDLSFAESACNSTRQAASSREAAALQATGHEVATHQFAASEGAARDTAEHEASASVAAEREALLDDASEMASLDRSVGSSLQETPGEPPRAGHDDALSLTPLQREDDSSAIDALPEAVDAVDPTSQGSGRFVANEDASKAAVTAGVLRSRLSRPATRWRGGGNHSRLVAVALSVGVVAAAATVVLTKPKHRKPVILERLALPASAAPPLATHKDTTTAESVTPRPASEEIPPLATVSSPRPSASALGSASSAVAAPTARDSFADAFKRHAAMKDAKWAELKDRSASSDPVKPAAGNSSPGAKKGAEPGSADPMEVLKRLEEARKTKRP
ncbi:MAG TPA: hypothetical protein VIV60_21740 [Polyangiaceae bacterium]